MDHFVLYVQACDKLCGWFDALGHNNQAHEQSNKSLQEHGGAVGLYENPEALTLFILLDRTVQG